MSAARTRPSASLAPWAEIVPDAPWSMTVDDLMGWPDDDGYCYELVEGTLVRVEGEVVSPSQEQDDMDAKAALYLRGGTRLVWVVWPGDERIDVWHPADRRPVTLYRGDMLDGEDVIPGFGHPVDAIFTDDLG